MIREATDNGVSPEGKNLLEALLEKYRDIFRIKLGADKPARVEPLKIESVPGARPFKTPQRRYAPLQTAFINTTIKDLELVGAVRRNPSAKWASAALAVPKPGTTKQRFTVDLRGVNSRTVPVQSATGMACRTLNQSCRSWLGAACFPRWTSRTGTGKSLFTQTHRR